VEHLKETEASVNHRRRHRRTTITLTAAAVLMLGTFAFAAAYYQGWIGDKSSPTKPRANSSNCQKGASGQAATAKAVTINVYNATDRQGLAATVAKSLRTQGFKVGKVANDPLSKSIGGVGEVRRGPAGEASATLAAARLYRLIATIACCYTTGHCTQAPHDPIRR
jgi:hypothetical protein